MVLGSSACWAPPLQEPLSVWSLPPFYWTPESEGLVFGHTTQLRSTEVGVSQGRSLWGTRHVSPDSDLDSLSDFFFLKVF